MVPLTGRVWKNDSVSASEPDNRETLSAISSTDHHEGASLRKQPTFGDATTGFPGGETSGSVAKCQLFSQATRELKQDKASENVDLKKWICVLANVIASIWIFLYLH